MACPTTTNPTPATPSLSPYPTDTTTTTTIDNNRRGLLQILLDFLSRLLELFFELFFGHPSPVPTSPPPAPTNVPTVDVTPTHPHLPISTSPTPISVDDLHYINGNEPLKEFNLVAEQIGDTDEWGYNGQRPGPELRVNQGDHVKINLLNNLPDESTTIHWHGIVIQNAADGVAGVTQNAIPVGKTYTYDFTVPDSGTFLYHSHQNTSQQMPKGLVGPLIVQPRTQNIDADKEYTITYWNAPTTQPVKHLDALPGERVRVRLVNGREPDFSGEPLHVAFVGAPFQATALDGQEINKPQEIAANSQLLPIGMAQRVDIEFIMPQTGNVQIFEVENLQTTTIVCIYN